MKGLIGKIWFLVAVMPAIIFGEGYDRLKKFLEKNNYKPEWAYILVIALVLILVVLLLVGYQ